MFSFRRAPWLTARTEVDHLNFRVIPTPSASEGLVIGWPQQPVEMEQLKNVQDEISVQL